MSRNFVADKLKIKGIQTLSAIALVLMLTITSLPFADAQTIIETLPFLSVSPKTIGLGQSVIVNAWITPPPEINWLYSNYYFDITKPNGDVVTMGPYFSEPAATVWFNYVPDQLGNYSVIFRWAGGNNTANYTKQAWPPRIPYQPVTSPPVEFTVQQEAPPAWPVAPFLEGYWDRGLSGEFREWATIAGGGDWVYPTTFDDTWRPDGLGDARVNPYSRGPNTAHIAWFEKPTMAGMIGDVSGEIVNPSFPMISVIMSGVGYYQLNGLHAIDIRTGKELWVNTAMTVAPSFGDPGQYVFVEGVGSSVLAPSLWYVGQTAIQQYSAETGALIANYPGIMSIDIYFVAEMFNPDGSVLIWFGSPDAPYNMTRSAHAASGTGHFITLWNSSKPGTTFADKTVFKVPGTNFTLSEHQRYKDVIIDVMPPSNSMMGINATTGKMLWNVTRATDDVLIGTGGAVGYGKYFWASIKSRAVVAVDVYTGRELWRSDTGPFPWGGFWTYDPAVAYGKVYFGSYDGHFYAFDAETGKTVWSYYSGDTSETPYNTYPWYNDVVVADGKIYAGQSEHSPTQPLARGRRIFCFDANNGTVIWSIAGEFEEKALADGVLVSRDLYTGQLFGFGKGQTAVTVSASPKIIASGNSLLIEGTVLDQSPAQLGTPAIADESMTAWMEYLHMNRPIPGNATGVPVKLTAMDPNGNTEQIGTVTSDISGAYSIVWTPPVPGKYVVTASFDGSESYWQSSAETAIAVMKAPAAQPTASPSLSPTASPPPTASPTPAISPTPPTPPSSPASPMTLYIVAAAAVIIIVVAAAVLALRRRK